MNAVIGGHGGFNPQTGHFDPNLNQPPPFVEFILDSEEDREATIAKGTGEIVMRDVHLVQLRQRGCTDFTTKKVSEWLPEMRLYSSTGRQPAHWADEYQKGYDRWKADMDSDAVVGYDLRRWPGMTSKALLHNLWMVGIRTVEDVARMTQTVCDQIGMGSMALRNRAISFLEAQKGKSHAEEASQLRADVQARDQRIADLEKNIAEINAKLGKGGK